MLLPILNALLAFSDLAASQVGMVQRLTLLTSDDCIKELNNFTIPENMTVVNIFQLYRQSLIPAACGLPSLQDLGFQVQKPNVSDCIKLSYQISKEFEQLKRDVNEFKYQQVIADLTNILESVAPALEACGQTQFAELFKKLLPSDCIAQAGVVSKDLVELAHKFDNWYWDIKFAKVFLQDLRRMAAACPLL